MERRAENRSWRNIRIRMHTIMWKADMFAVRFMLGMSAITWGLLMLLPTEDPTFSIMFKLLPQIAWAAAFIVQGLVMLWSLICGKTPRITLWADAILGCTLWTSTTLSMFIISVYEYGLLPVTLGPEIWISLASAWLLVRHYSDEDV